MPSQVATLSLYIACKILFQLDIEYMAGEFSQTEIALQEMAKVLGYNLHEGGLAELKNDVLSNKAVREMLRGYGYRFSDRISQKGERSSPVK